MLQRQRLNILWPAVRASIAACGLLLVTAGLMHGTNNGLNAAEPAAGKVPAGLPPVKHPDDNPPSEAKIALGRQLYFDGRLSRDGKVSCAICHDPSKGFSNAEQFATGVEGKKGGRNSPAIHNAAYNRFQFWDGRAGSLEEQAVGPIQNPIEMTMTLPEVVARLNAIAGYRTQFQAVFKTDVTAENLARAIAAFERTLLAGDAPYDRFHAGQKDALSAGAQRGMALFFGKGACSSCHPAPLFTDNGFHNVGIGMKAEKPDVGREAISKLSGDRGGFKTPTLRDIARTAPYMHDGSIATLEEVIEHYIRGGVPNETLDEEIFPLKLTNEQKADLILFLKEGLTSSSYPAQTAPELPK